MEINNSYKDLEKEGNYNMYSNINYDSNYNMAPNSNNNAQFINSQNMNYIPPSAIMPPNNQIYNPQLINNNIANTDFIQGRNVLFMSNLPYNTNETDIKLFFKKYGDDVTLMSLNHKNSNEGNISSMSAKVIFKDSIIADQARREMNLRKLKGHAIRLMWDERDNNIRYNSSSNLFIKGIPFNVQPREVYEYFYQFGDISSAILREDDDGNHLGYGYVTYYDPRSAEIAIKSSNGKIIWGEGPIQVEHFKKKNERYSIAGPEVYKIHITNFPGDFTKNDIIELTKEFGSILDVSIKTEKIGRRYALICYDSEEAANKARESLEGKNINGYNLLCKIIKDKINPEIPQKKFRNDYTFNNNRFAQKPEHVILTSEQKMCNLHIKNIPFTINEAKFKEIFSTYGKIVSCKLETYNLITHYGGQFNSVPTSKGFGYVCYEDPEVAKKVKNELDKKFLPGYEHWKDPLAINFFMSKSQKAINSMNLNYINNDPNNNYIDNNVNKDSTPNDSMPEFNINKFKNINNDKDKEQYLGEYIYYQIFTNSLLRNYPEEEKKEYVGKITGMILNCQSLDKVAEICLDNDLLNKMISESFKMINNNKYS